MDKKIKRRKRIGDWEHFYLYLYETLANFKENDPTQMQCLFFGFFFFFKMIAWSLAEMPYRLTFSWFFLAKQMTISLGNYFSSSYQSLFPLTFLLVDFFLSLLPSPPDLIPTSVFHVFSPFVLSPPFFSRYHLSIFKQIFYCFFLLFLLML